MVEKRWKMREVTIRKYRAVQERFNYLYNQKRIRYDDCILQLQEEFFYSARSVHRILTTDLPIERKNKKARSVMASS
jgi:hypothetical protein